MRRTTVVALALGWIALGLSVVNLTYHFARASESYVHAVAL
jgi:hypothetical protein